jgi:signal transduction histidine kinase
VSSPSSPSRIPQWCWDVGASVFVLASAFAHVPSIHESRSTIGWIVSLLPVVLILFRRRFPWTVLVACVACYGILLFTDPGSPFAAVAVAISVYTVAAETNRRTTVLAAAGVVVVLLTVLWISTSVVLHPTSFQIAATTGFAAAVGDAVRSRRAYIAEITQRAIRAEQTREAEASRRVAEDRLRIARDLHDAVAHQISVISLNAAVASKSLDTQPEKAREALTTIRSASRRVLNDIGELLSTLRVPDENAVPTPTAGLALLPALVVEFAASGLQTTLREEPDVPPLPPAVDVVAYRVIQEALTNAHKHGTGARAHVLISRTASGVHLVVTNPVTTQEVPGIGTGHGLAGIRERVDSVRGTVTAGRTGDTYRLEADFPLEGP